MGNLGQHIPLAIKQKLTYEGQSRPVIIMCSVGSNSQSEGEPLAAQIVLANQLLELGLASEGVVLGCCTLQWHTRFIKNFKDLVKFAAKDIKDLWRNAEKRLITSGLLRETSDLLGKLLKFKFEANIPQRQQILALLQQIYQKIMQAEVIDFLQMTEEQKAQLKRLISQAGFNAQIVDEAVKQTLRMGNEWGHITSKNIIKKYANQANIIPIMRWPAIYDITDPVLKQSTEYKAFVAQYKEICPLNANTLIQKMPFPTEESKQQYLDDIKEFYCAEPQCKEAFDNNVTSYLRNSDPKNNWEREIGYSQAEISQASLDFLFEECAWLAYMAKEHPEVLILYPGPLMLAIQWAYKQFHPNQEVCLLSVTTSSLAPQTQLSEGDKMKSQQIREQKAEKITEKASNNKITLSIISPHGEISMQYEGTLPPGDVLREFQKTVATLTSTTHTANEQIEIPEIPNKSYSCTIL